MIYKNRFLNLTKSLFFWCPVWSNEATFHYAIPLLKTAEKPDLDGCDFFCWRRGRYDQCFAFTCVLLQQWTWRPNGRHFGKVRIIAAFNDQKRNFTLTTNKGQPFLLYSFLRFLKLIRKDNIRSRILQIKVALPQRSICKFSVYFQETVAQISHKNIN
jgi:hypothetical protein